MIDRSVNNSCSCVLSDLVDNRLIWLDSHLFALWSWDIMTGQQVLVDEFHSDDKGLAGIAVFEVVLTV